MVALLKQYRKAALIVVAIAVLYCRVLGELGQDWCTDPDYSHGLVIPFIVLWLLWRRKAQFENIPATPSNIGLVIIVGSLAVLFLGDLGAELFLTRISLVGLIVGFVLFFRGWRTLSEAAFPLGLLLLVIPLPAIIFYQITFPLQLLASKLGSFLLESVHVPVLREGNVMVLPNITLEVAEACSGIRSLFTLATLTVLYGYLAEDSVWLRAFLFGFTVPLALFCNGLRIMGTGLLGQYVDPSLAEGFFHTFSGWFIFVIAFFTLLGAHKCMALLKPNRGKSNATVEEPVVAG
jgi:exosortase